MDAGHRSPIRLLLVDDHTIVRTGLRMILESRSGFRVVAEAGSVQEAMEAVEHEPIDVVLLDLDLNGESGLAFLEPLRDLQPKARVILLTGLADRQAHREAIHAGAVGLVSKGQVKDHLLLAVEKVHAGEAWLDRSMIADLLSDISGRRNADAVDPEEVKIRSLTEREHEVVQLIAEGLSNRQIAERISISETTVRHHLSSIFSKIGVSSRLELVVYAYRRGMVPLSAG
ncbi:MAG: response regulator transcription factor [Oscillochloris sp.]|nr:response regulator transcription factor [Oscillochloris sp.]